MNNFILIVGETMKPKVSKQRLYLRLAKDAESVSKREKRYAEMAKFEKKFSGKDRIIAIHKKQPARIDDDTFENDICMEFYKYRMGISAYYANMAKKYRKLAQKADD
jgi:hypothetical protein